MTVPVLLPLHHAPPSGPTRHVGWTFWCLACSCFHQATTEEPNERGDRWTLEGDVHVPTFREPFVTEHEGRRCVCRVEEAWIVYDEASTHALAGQAFLLHVPTWLLTPPVAALRSSSAPPPPRSDLV